MPTTQRGKRAALWIAGLGLSALTACAIAFHERLIEEYEVWRLEAELEKKAAGLERNPADSAVEQKLSHPISLRIQGEGIPVQNVLAVLSQYRGIPISVFPGGTAGARSRVLHQDVHVLERPTREFLEETLASCGDPLLGYAIEEGMVLVGPKDWLETGRTRSGRLYSSFQELPVWAKHSSDGRNPGARVEELLEKTRSAMENPDGEIIGSDPRVLNARLWVKTTARVHRKIQKLMKESP